MTIPATNSQLLVSEDWKKIYQSFRNAEFQSYDFETLRRTMIQYIQENYPEDFNDFIDSSEYIALIDLIAFLGQNLSFRIDLNARENFIETAQRRDSILRLAQLISYIPARNVPSSGFLKLTAINTTDNVIDSNGVNLANTTISWNDPTNPNWYQQFVTIINSTMAGSYSFGKPYDRKTIDGILTEQYRINSSNQDVPVFGFSKNVNGTTMNFEIVSATMSGKTSVYEEPPKPSNTFSFIYKNDNQGSGSPNTGFFIHFRQGQLGVSTFFITNPVSNEIVGVNTPNINDTDVWLWQIDQNENYSELWTKVPSVVGNNIIYNSLNKDERNIYSVTSRDQDQIDLNFADGIFGNLPQGQFKLFYRQSNGLTYSIKPEQLSGIQFEVPYTNKSGQVHTITITAGLQYTVNNSSGPESNTSIQNKAPQSYYLQNRMVTGEDYNIAPLTLGSDILKVKSVNRVSSGLSKYFDLSDVSGKYSKTNIFATDGIIYKDSNERNFEFEFTNRNEIFAVIKKQVSPLIQSSSLRSFYFDKFRGSYSKPLDGYTWVQVSKESGQSKGYFKNSLGPVNVGIFATDNMQYVLPGALIKFQTSLGYVWSTVMQVIGDGSNSGVGILDDGNGPIALSNIPGNSSIPVEIIPKYINSFTYSFESEIVNLCYNQRNFGLTINNSTRLWNIILDTNLNLTQAFSLSDQGSISNSNEDASWIVAFVWTGKSYKVRYRYTEFIFESEKETAFFVENDNLNYDFYSNTVIKDKIDILSINAVNTSTSIGLGKDYSWQIDDAVIEPDGYVEPKKVKVSFYDYNSSGQIENPDTFDDVVQPLSTSSLTSYYDKFVYFKKLSDGQRYERVDRSNFKAFPNPESVEGTTLVDGDLYYFYDSNLNVVKRYDQALADTADPWVYESDYFAFSGRDNLKFHYVHNSNEDRRIDPSKSNIIDIYMLTSSYDTEYRLWLASGTGVEPLSPTSQSLEQSYSALLEPIKTISDEIIFQPVKYKVLFGSMANINLQGTFKAVKNSTRPVSDNELKSRILDAIDNFFNLENWEFGQSFYFSELATYVMNQLTPDITNFVIVPKSSGSFGSLYEVACLSNEIFISGATADDIEIIEAITASQLKTSNIISSSGT